MYTNVFLKAQRLTDNCIIMYTYYVLQVYIFWVYISHPNFESSHILVCSF